MQLHPPFRLPALACVLLSAAAAMQAQEGIKPNAGALTLKRNQQLSDDSVKSKEGTDAGPIFLGADSIKGVLDDEINAEGNAELRKRGLSVKADTLRYQSVSDLAEAKGNVRLFREGNLYTGPELKITTETGEGLFRLPTYKLAKTGGGGTASRIAFLDKRRSVAYDANYSTCPRDDMAWQLTADEVALDFEEEEGVGTDVKLTFKGVPLIVAPKLSFPLTDKRRSGLLPPQVALSTRSGLEYTQPYYWDIAPNRDYTFFPTLISKRGVLLGNEFRYLERNFSGQIDADWVPRDALRDQEQRWGAKLKHTGTALGALSYGVNLARVSDNDYFTDFPRIGGEFSQRVLPADVNASYAIPYGALSSRFVRYQTLQDSANSIPVPYDLEPQLGAGWQRLNWSGFDAALQVQWSRFRHPTQISGERTVFAPSLAYPIQAPGYFAIPKVSLRQANYRVNSPLNSLGSPASEGTTSQSVTIPTFSLDSGLVFERDANFFGNKYLQTLEPRAFYVNTPYRNQATLPLFDTGPLDFSFPAIYSDNAFSGYDRVSDDHTLTIGLSSRLLDSDTGAERLKLQFAQRVRFRDQLVTATNVPNSERLSDALFGATFSPNERFAFDTTVQYSPDTKRSVRSTIGGRYSPAPFKTLSLGYTLNRNAQPTPTEQLVTAWQWPLDFAGLPHVYTVGRVNYSREEKRVTDAIAGLEWERDCWLFRFVAQRTSTDVNTATTRFYLQLELKGLTRLGTNPLGTLNSNIPQYRVLGQPSERPSPYNSYE